MESNALARKRASVIFRVRSGQITATQGATELGVSRKTYYEWENKALAAMSTALANGQGGRPRQEMPDPETTALRRRISQLEQELETAKQTVAVRRILEAMHKKQAQEAARKEKKRRRRRK